MIHWSPNKEDQSNGRGGEEKEFQYAARNKYIDT